MGAQKVEWERGDRINKQRRERSPLDAEILFGFTEHPITVWAGVILLRLYFEWVGLRKEPSEALESFRTVSEQLTKASPFLIHRALVYRSELLSDYFTL